MPRKAKLAVIKKHYETLSKTDKFDLLRSQGCVFQYIIRDQSIYYYLHGWYASYGKAFIAYKKMEIISGEHVRFLNTLIHDYQETEQALISIGEIAEELEESESPKLFEELSYGKNCLMTYRVYRDKKTPSDITQVEILVDPKNQIFLKKDIRIPKLLLPGGIEQSKPKKTAKEILEEKRASKILKKQMENI